MIIAYSIIAGLLVISFIADRKRTIKALRIALKKIIKILPAFLVMLMLVSVLLFFVPEEVISKYLGKQNSLGNISIAALIGSVSMIPGFIAYPLCGILRSTGVSMSVIAAFATSLMLVGVISFPIERKYIGTKIAVIRNITALIMSILIAFVIGAFYGEFLI